MTDTVRRLDRQRDQNDPVGCDAVDPSQFEVNADVLNLLPINIHSVLDLGYGNDTITNTLPAEWTVIGINNSLAALRRSVHLTCVASASQLPFVDNAFDLVLAKDMIEHLPNNEIDAVLREVERVAKQCIIMIIPFTGNLGELLEHAGTPAVCRKINEQFCSFDLTILRDLYKNFELDCVVFSGSEWHYETEPIEDFKALVERLRETQASRATNEFVLTDENVTALLRLLRTEQARKFAKCPENIEFSRLRTAIICLYYRRDADREYPIPHAIRTRGMAAEAVPVTEIDLNMIDFRHPERYFQPFLPTMSRFPYVITSAAISRTPDGSQFVLDGDADCWDMKVGFFHNAEGRGKLEIIGKATGNITLAIACHGAFHEFRPIGNKRVCGNFHIILTDLEFSYSQYGILFLITVTGGPLLLQNIHLSTDQPSHRLIYTQTPEYLLTTHDGVEFFLSCRFYGNNIPVLPWFKIPVHLPAQSPPLHSISYHDAATIETAFKVVAVLGSRIEQLSVFREKELVKLRNDHLAQQCALREETYRRGAEIESQFVSLRRELQDLKREFEEIVPLRDSGFRKLVEDARAREEASAGKAHRLAEAVLRLEVREQRLARRLHVVERLVSPVLPVARYITRICHAIRQRFAKRHLMQVRFRQLAVGRPPIATYERAVVMLVADNRIDRRVLAQARSLVARGWRVSIIAAPYPGPLDMDQEAVPEVQIARIDTNQPAPPFARPASMRLPAVRNAIEAYPYYDHFLERALQYQVAIVTAHDLPVLPAAIAAAEICGARVVYDAHELYPEQHHFGPELSELYREVERNIIHFADAVTTVNLSIANEMAQRYGIPLPQVVLNAPEVDRASLPMPRGNLIHEQLYLSESRRILLFQGVLSLDRNLENLTYAMAHVRTPDIALVFLGPGLEKRAELSEIAAATCTLGDKVFFLDPVDQKQLLGYTASADVGIIPYPPIDLNSRLCTPNKLFEFIVAGVPILANDLPELRRFVYDNNFGQVHPLNGPESIAAAIDMMFAADLEIYRQSLRIRCHEFTWEQQAGTITDLYEQLFSASRASRQR